MPYKDPEMRKKRHREYMRTWTKEHRTQHVKLVTACAKKRLALYRERVNKIKSVPCLDCGSSFDPIAMDFDHVGKGKVGNVGQMLIGGSSWKKILAEIAKCEIICSNCHRVRTRDRGYSDAGPQGRSTAS